MPEMTRISVPVTITEREILRVSAEQNLRHPREQARYLLRQALGLTTEDVEPQQMNNRAGADSQTVPNAIVD